MKSLLKKENFTGIVIALFATLVSFVSLLKGVSIPSGDSVANLECSRVQAESFEHSFGHYELDSTGNAVLTLKEVNTIWPPSASFFVGGLQVLGFSLYTSIFIFILFFTFTTTYLSWKLNYRITKSEKTSFYLTLLLVSLWGFRYWVATPFMPEGVFITASLLASLYIYQLATVKKKIPFYKFIIAGILLASTYYVKSAAPGFIAAGALSVLFVGTTIMQRIGNAFWTGIGVIAGALPWLLRNLSYGTIGSEGNGARSNALVESAIEFVRVFIPYHGPYTAKKYILALAALFCILVFVLIILNVKKSIAKSSIKRFAKQHFLFIFSTLYLITFITIMLFAMYVLPLASHIEMRYWLELVPFIIPWFWYIIHKGKAYISTKYHVIYTSCCIALFFVILGANIFESVKNERKNWVYLPKDAEKLETQKQIHKILNNKKNVRFISNPGYRFEIRTGLTTAWFKTAEKIPNDSMYCFADYKENWANSMNYVPNNVTHPEGWIKVGTVHEFDLYVPDK